MDRLRAIEIFLKVVELGSFQRTAANKGITPQAVSKTIRDLEKELGIRLFNRTTRNNRLTEEGRRFAQRVSPGIESVNQAWNETLGAMAEDSGTIRITATPSVAKKLLLPIIAAFRALYPDIRIDLIIDTRLTELVEAGIDIGFRSGSSPSNQLIVRKLFHTQLLICASPEYLRRHQLPKSADELFDHICTGSRQASSGRIEPWEFLTEAKEVEYRDMASPFLVNDLETEVEALLQGIGIGQIDSLNAVSHLRNGGLIPILGEHMHEHYGVFMYYAYRDLPKRTKKFVDFVLAQVGDASAFRLTDEEIGRLSVFR